MFSKDIGIDLGTANILVFVRGKGIVIQEPAVVAMEVDRNRISAIGDEARRMIGRTPGNIQAIRPLRGGVIADYEITESILEYFINKAIGNSRFFRPRVVICVPSGVTSVERRAVLDAASQAGAKDVYLISEPMAGAIGCGLDVAAPDGNMIVDIGGGTTDIAVISLGGEVVCQSLKVGGDHLEECICRYVKRAYNLAIGERTAEEIKIEIGSAYPYYNKKMNVRGRDLVTGMPCTIELSAGDVFSSIEEPIHSIIDVIKSVLEITPPELAADIINNGMVLTGGGALLNGLPKLIQERTGVPVYLADEPLTCVARGTGKVLNSINKLKQGVILASKSVS